MQGSRVVKGIGLFVLMILVAVFAAGCGRKQAASTQPAAPAAAEKSGGPVELTIWETYRETEHALFMKIVDEFMAAHPNISIKVEQIPWGGHQAKILTAMATKSTPDVARIDVAWVTKLAKKGGILALDEYGAAEIKDDFVPAAMASNIVDGKIYGLPDQTNCAVLFYNKDHFKAAGLDPEKPPKTWEEFVEYGKKLTNEAAGRYGFGMDNTLWWTFPFFSTFGAKFLDESGTKCVLNSPEGIKALQFKVDLYRKYKIEAGAWIAGGVNPETGFQSGKYSMILDGPWNVARYRDAGLNFGVALVPAGPAGTASNVGGTNMVVFNTCKHPKEAFEFLKYLTSPEVQARWAKELKQVPVNLKAYDLVDTSADPYLAVFMEQMKTAVARPQVENYDMLEEIINPEMETALNGTKTVEEALNAAVERINSEIFGQQAR